MKTSVFIKEHDDGYRAFWVHRPWDCVKYEQKLVNLRLWLSVMEFAIVKEP